MAEQRKSHHLSKNSSQSTRSSAVHRRFERRMGSPCSRTKNNGALVTAGKELAHQLLGVGSTVERSTSFQVEVEAVPRGGHDRQHHGSRPNQKPGGDSIQAAHAADHRTANVGAGSTDNLDRKTHPGTPKCNCRQPQQRQAATARRVVAQSERLQQTVETLGETPNRPVRPELQQQVAAVRQPRGGRPSHRTRRPIAAVGRAGGICIPANDPHPGGSAQTSSVKQHKDDPDCAVMAKPNLVSATSGNADSDTAKARKLTHSATTEGQVSRKSRNTQPSRLEVVVGGYRKAGFSAAAAARMARATRQSTNRVYQSKWKYFADWCNGRKTSPLKASIPVIADFLLHLRDEKKFTVSTIKGYRSAIALALKTVNTDVSTSPELTALVRAMAGELPPREPTPPKWNLTLVLETLITEPYEPLEEASLKFLTHKCVFLLALASAKRVSELQALSGRIAHKEDWSSVSFDFARDFLAKTEVPSSTRNTIRSFQIPALSQLSSEHNDLLLCPVRALKIYSRRTADRRTENSRLFIPVLGTREAVSRNTISAWIASVIRRAYLNQHGDLQALHRVSAHEVRAIATSWHFHHTLSLENVMRAASWRTHSTFSSFYLRDVSMMADGLLQLGPIVAAQHAL